MNASPLRPASPYHRCGAKDTSPGILKPVSDISLLQWAHYQKVAAFGRMGSMRCTTTLTLLLAMYLLAADPAFASPCDNPRNALGVSRVVEIDTTGGATFGSLSRRKDKLLRHKEVVLTFDDGPIAGRTEKIVKALARYCTKATFFAVGTMALAYPKSLRRVAAAGHTIANHTWKHARLTGLSFARAKLQIDKGHAAISAAIGRPAAPFFRFPYLRDSRALIGYLGKRNIANFAVDIVSGDTDGYGVKQMVKTTMRRLRKRGRGILLFHDIKKVTTRAIPHVLAALRKEGYKVVHVVPKTRVEPNAKYAKMFQKRLARHGLVAPAGQKSRDISQGNITLAATEIAPQDDQAATALLATEKRDGDIKPKLKRKSTRRRSATSARSTTRSGKPRRRFVRTAKRKKQKHKASKPNPVTWSYIFFGR